MAEDKPQQVDFTIVPDDRVEVARTYSNFCAIQNSPFDFTLTFCEMHPLGEKEIREAQSTQIVRAPVRARMVVPVGMVPGLIAALQENYQLFQETYGPPKGPLH